MKSTFVTGLMLLALLTLPMFRVSVQTTAQESEQYRIEGATILQDNNEPEAADVTTRSDIRRNTRLAKDGFSALIGETPLRMNVQKSILDYGDNIDDVGKIAETPVKIIYTKDGGYSLYAGVRVSTATNEMFNPTGCDYGINKCFTALAAPWVMPEVAGYGYHIDGVGAAPDFIDQTYFRPFAVVNTVFPTGALVALGEGAPENQIILKTRLNEAKPKQGTFLQTIVITALNDW